MLNQVRRNFYIPEWADRGLDWMYQRTGDSKAHHMRKALVEYLERNGLSADGQPETEIKKLNRLSQEIDGGNYLTFEEVRDGLGM